MLFCLCSYSWANVPNYLLAQPHLSRNHVRRGLWLQEGISQRKSGQLIGGFLYYWFMKSLILSNKFIQSSGLIGGSGSGSFTCFLRDPFGGLGLACFISSRVGNRPFALHWTLFLPFDLADSTSASRSDILAFNVVFSTIRLSIDLPAFIPIS